MGARKITTVAIAATLLCGLIIYVGVFTPHEKPFRALDQSAPRLSPDGKTVLFDMVADDGCFVAMQDLSTGEFQQLTWPPTNCFSPIWSADGKEIFFTRKNNREHNLWSMKADGSSWKQLTFGKILDVPLTTSPDGSLLYFLRENWKGRFALPVVEIWSLDPRQSPSQPVFIGQGLSISSDGSVVASLVESNFQQRVPKVAVKNNRNGATTQALDGFSPSLSPNGKLLAYTGVEKDWGNDIVWLADTDTLSKEIIDDTPGVKSEPVFSSDGSNLLFRSFSTNLVDTKIVIISLPGKSKQQISIHNH